ncbi:MAG: tRNA pseudouridine(55) synthase TruB [Gemmatimonadota bacterium]
MTETRSPDGVLLVDKPAGLSSHAVVDRARRALGTRRIGHGGTLDPFATGLLVLLLGRATRLLPYLAHDPKVYRATIRFGRATTTDDATGEPVNEAPVPAAGAVEEAVAAMTGYLLQRPPAFSAKQVGGVRAYKAARRGKPMTLEPVAVHVHGWRLLGWAGADLDVEVSCGPGTYVRALARDLGEASASAAHLVALRRLRSGPFDVTQAQTLGAIEDGAARLLSPASAVSHLPDQPLDDLEAKRIVHGQMVRATVDGPRAALSHAGELLAVAEREDGQWRPRVVLRDA